MSLQSELDGFRRRERPHSSHSHTPYLGLDPYNGVPIQCQYCSGQSFRRSTLRVDDFIQILRMRYPVRCLRCGQRQLVSYTVASLSISSSIKPRRRHRPVAPSKPWVDFTRHPDAPNPLIPPQPEDSHPRR
jgi:DNA-directed RNA polymerase subunit RPC12/RpoP